VFIRHSPKNFKKVRNDCACGSYRRKNPALEENCEFGMKNASIPWFGGLSKLAAVCTADHAAFIRDNPLSI
jgi:hypothetical protein